MWIALSLLVVLGLLAGVFGCAAPAPTTPAATTPTATTPKPTTPTATTPKPTTPAPTTAAPGVFKVVSIGPLSGAAAPWGVAQSRAMHWAADKINEEGGLTVEGKKYTVEVIDYDSEYKMDKSVDAANRAIFFDEVKYLCVTGGANIKACQPITERNGVLHMANSLASKELCNPDKPLSFLMMINCNPMGPTVYYPELVKEFGVSRLAVVNPDDDTGYISTGVIEGVIKVQQIPLEIVAKEYFTRGTQDFTPVVLRLLAAKPDLIDMAVGSQGDNGLLMKQLGEAGYTGLHLNSCSIMDTHGLYQLAGEYAVGHFCIGQCKTPPTPEYGAFEERYVKEFGESMNPVAPYTYEEWYYLFKAINEANSFDTLKVAYIYENMEWDGLFGHFRWGGTEAVFGFGIDRTPVAPYPLGRVGPNGDPEDWLVKGME